jgi:hypothetical protein
MFDRVTAFADAYSAAYQTLYQAQPITCSVTGTAFDAVPAPCAAIIDVSIQSTVILTGYDCLFLSLFPVLCSFSSADH